MSKNVTTKLMYFYVFVLAMAQPVKIFYLYSFSDFSLAAH